MECKYSLPCGVCELKNTLCTMTFPTSETSSDIASSDDYTKAIEFLKKEKALAYGFKEDQKGYYTLAIKALQKERDMYFPGVFTKKVKWTLIHLVELKNEELNFNSKEVNRWTMEKAY